MSQAIFTPEMEMFHTSTHARPAMHTVENPATGRKDLLEISRNPKTNAPEVQYAVTVIAMEAVERIGKKEDGSESRYYSGRALKAKYDLKTKSFVLDANKQQIIESVSIIVPASQITQLEVGVSYWATARPLPNNPTLVGLSVGGLRVNAGFIDATELDGLEDFVDSFAEANAGANGLNP